MSDQRPTCEHCAWRVAPNEGAGCRARSAQEGGSAPLPAEQTCALWEPLPSCQACGACCREAFDTVPVTEAELARLPELAQRHADGWLDLRRIPSPSGRGTWCAALTLEGGLYTCAHYPARPQTCRDVEEGSDACLTARRRVGLSPWPPGARPHGPWFEG